MSFSCSRFDLPSSFLTGTVVIAALVISPPHAIAAKSPQEIAQSAIPVTVQINPEKGGGGSGVIIKRQGNTYMALTCIHVVESAKFPGVTRPSLSVRTYDHLHDAVSYPVTNVQKLGTQETSDLALVTFNSSTNYPVAKLAKSDQAVIGAQIFVFGYPALEGKTNSERDFEFSPGFVTSRPNVGSPKGYEPYTIRYNAVTKGGMSGGPVFDVDGRVIGVHGYGGQEEAAGGTIELKTGFNAAVPIDTLLAVGTQSGQQSAKLDVDDAPSTDKPAERLTHPESASDFVAKGAVAQEQGDSAQALAAYNQAISRDSGNADAYYQRANARYDRGDKQGALADYNQAISHDPKYANAYYQRGVILFNQGDKQGALADFSQYISLAPGDTEGYYNRGLIRRDLRDYQGMLADFDQVVNLTPHDPKAYYNRGLAHSMLRDRQGTLEDFNQALSLDPNWTTVYENRAILRRRMGDREGAIADFSSVIRLQPDNAIAYYNRGLIRRDLGDRQSAVADLQSAANIYQKQGDTVNYQKVQAKIQSIQASSSLPGTQQPQRANNSGQSSPNDSATPQSQQPLDDSGKPNPNNSTTPQSQPSGNPDT